MDISYCHTIISHRHIVIIHRCIDIIAYVSSHSATYRATIVDYITVLILDIKTSIYSVVTTTRIG